MFGHVISVWSQAEHGTVGASSLGEVPSFKPVPLSGLVALPPSPSGTRLLRKRQSPRLNICLDLWYDHSSFARIRVAGAWEAVPRS